MVVHWLCYLACPGTNRDGPMQDRGGCSGCFVVFLSSPRVHNRGCRGTQKGLHMQATPSPTHPGVKTIQPELLLLDAVIAITAYRRELQKAGYPFREPPKVAAIIAAIEDYCAPADIRTIKARGGK